MSRGGATRFAKGASGNPKGRPRKSKLSSSAFDIIIDRTLTVTQNGVERELTIDEALQQRTYQDAVSGSRMARREVLKMIAKREKWLADRSPVKTSPITVERGHEGRTADEAMLLLGIASRLDPRPGPNPDTQLRLALENWVVDAGFKRARRRAFTEKDLAEIRRSVRDPEAISWPCPKS